MTQPALASQRVIWMALLTAVIACIGLGLSGIVPAATGPPPAGGLLLWIFGALSLLLAVLAGMYHARATMGAPPGPATGGPPPTTTTRPPFRIVGWALQEAIGTFGFVLALLGHPRFEWLPFCVASLALLLMHGPRAEPV